MADTSELESIIFLDIETVPGYRSLAQVPDELREIWAASKKRKGRTKAEEIETECPAESSDGDAASFDEKAGLRPEFGKVICISLGRFVGGNDDSKLKVHSIASDDEKQLLSSFNAVLEKYPTHRLCAHNGKGFDFPYLGRRLLINGLPLPSQLDVLGKKPWEIPHIDTMELWCFGGKMKDNVSLKLLCAVFGIPSPKDDIDGSEVRNVYYTQNDLPRIVKYCEKDVTALTKIYKRMCCVK